MRRLTVIAVGALLALALMPGIALGHDVQAVSGTVDCDGNYSITVHGDVYGTVHLIVKLDGAVISDAVTGQQGSGFADYGPFAGTGAEPGQAIFAKSSDESDANGASGALVLTAESCEQPTPTPTATPTATPTDTPRVTPTPSLPTLPPTDATGDQPGNAFPVALFVAGIILVAAGYIFVTSFRYRR